jgi:hypothetical protein
VVQFATTSTPPTYSTVCAAFVELTVPGINLCYHLWALTPQVSSVCHIPTAQIDVKILHVSCRSPSI